MSSSSPSEMTLEERLEERRQRLLDKRHAFDWPHEPHDDCPGITRTSACPLRCGYDYPIPACVRLHLIQHHNYTYGEAQDAYPDD